jgi:hypothetical protein
MIYIVLTFFLQFLLTVFSQYQYFEDPFDNQYLDKYCPTYNTNLYQAYEYSSAIRPIEPSKYVETTGQENNGMIIETYFFNDLLHFSYTGTFLEGPSSCRVCKYHLHSYSSDSCEQNVIDNIRTTCYSPMYGYCYSGSTSRKMSCVQNTLLYPTNFFGEYFYPDQRDSFTYYSTYYYMHKILQKTVSEGDFKPQPFHQRDYDWSTIEQGLSPTNVIRDLNREIYSYTGNFDNDNEQDDNVRNFRKKFNQDQNWTLWGQTRCLPACHRDSSFLFKLMDPSDPVYGTDNTFHFLPYHRYKILSVCKPCNSTYVAYRPDNVLQQPQHLFYKLLQYFSYYCIPWFGSVPVMNLITNPITFQYNIKSMGSNIIMIPTDAHTVSASSYSDVQEIRSVLCPVNHYNRKCAYYHHWKTMVELVGKQPVCEPCPLGWHTDGKNGSWFCIPPNGNQFLYWNKLTLFWNKNINQSSAWSRRDLLVYELECSAYEFNLTCRQCSSVPGAQGLDPELFNEKYIFQPLLQHKPCDQNYYCPHPLQEAIPCPLQRPCSYPGSISETNCSCCPGTFLNTATQNCEQCKSPNSCSGGQYLLGYEQCKSEVGEKRTYGGGTCVNCSFKPQYSTFLYEDNLNGRGKELAGAPGNHICGFQCNEGYFLKIESQSLPYLDTCDHTYTCDSMLQPWEYSNSKYFFPSLKSYTDRLNIIHSPNTRFECKFETLFTSQFALFKTIIAANRNQSDIEKYRVKTTCSQANSSYCSSPQSVCRVTSNATIFNDYACATCINGDFYSKPSNATWHSLAISALTDPSAQSKQCTWTCDQNYFQNNSLCVSCSDFALQVGCNRNQTIQGRGCAGNFSEFRIPYILNCIDCAQSRVTPPGQFLDVEKCLLRNCTAPPSIILGQTFISRLCGGILQDYVVSQCSACNFALQYQVSACTSNLDTICKTCTTRKAGFYMIAPCSSFQDSVWAECEENWYCDGIGTKFKCPPNMISRRGSQSLADCKCSIGWTLHSNGMQCTKTICPHEKSTFESPSLDDNIVSPYYYSYENDMTICKLCDSTMQGPDNWNVNTHAFASGNRFSCRCPVNKYAMTLFGNTSCNSCSSRDTVSSCVSNAFMQYPSSSICETGFERGLAYCQCFLPPFTQPVSSTQCLPICKADFVTNNDAAGAATKATDLRNNVTGSSTYVPQIVKQWTKILDFSSFSIKKLQVAGDSKDWDSDNVRLVFWTVHDPSLAQRIMIRTLKSTEDLFCSNSQCDIYSSPNGNSWSPLCPDEVSSGYVIHDFSVFKWFSSVPLVMFAPGNSNSFVGPSTWVSALVKHSTEMKYLLKIISVQFSFNQNVFNVLYPPPEFYCGAQRFVSLPPMHFHENTSVVSMHSAYGFPSEMPSVTTKRGGIYFAYNDDSKGVCGLYAVAHNDSILQNSKNLFLNMTRDRRRILALAVNVEYGIMGIAVYTLFSDYISMEGGIQRFRWTSESIVTNDAIVKKSSQNVYLFLHAFNPQLVIKSFDIAFSRLSESSQNRLMFLLNYDFEYPRSVLNWTSSVLVADSVQLTFTPIMNMPYYSYPGSLSVFEESDIQMKIVGHGKSSIYFLNLNRCSGSSSSNALYWDGTGCRLHHCRRKPDCQPELNEVWNNEKLECECKPGYYMEFSTKKCLECSEGYYCKSNSMQRCPSPSMISERSSTDILNCRCEYGYFLEIVGGNTYNCLPCPSGFFCPNGVQRLSCPGSAYHDVDFKDRNAFPDYCKCNEGYNGPKCEPCPEGHTCAYSLTSPFYVRNLAVTVLLNLKSGAENYVTQSAICSVFAQQIYLLHASQSQGYNYFSSQQDVLDKLYCNYIPNKNALSSQHGMSFISLMIQINENDANAGLFGIYEIFRTLRSNDPLGINAYATTPLTNFLDIIEVRPMDLNLPFPRQSTIKSTSKIQCSINFVPNSGRTFCECNAGYRYQGSRCVPCQLGWYKSLPGNLEFCTQCPIGKSTSTVGSVQCFSLADAGKNATQESQQQSINDLLPIIIGGAVGGVVIIIIIISVICFYS